MSFQVIAIRHAIPVSEGYASDDLRPLSNEGREQQKVVVDKLKERGLQPSLVLASPLLRAQQTAEIVAEAYGLSLETEEALGVPFDASGLLERRLP